MKIVDKQIKKDGIVPVEKIVLKTDRLMIRDHESEDLEALHSLLSDEKAMCYLEDLHTHSIEESLENLKTAINQQTLKNREKYYFAIFEKQTNRYVGEVGYDVIVKTDKGNILEMGYFLKPEFWGRGYASEAAKACVDYAFLKLKAHKIVMGCLKENSASEKVMVKLAFEKEGELIKHQHHEETWKDRVVYGKLRASWKK